MAQITVGRNGVLILVVVEDVLVQLVTRGREAKKAVLILVVVEDVLVRGNATGLKFKFTES